MPSTDIDAQFSVEGSVTKATDDVYGIDWSRDGGWNTLESLLGISSGAGGTVTFNEAFRQSSVLSCIDIISQDASKARLIMFEKLEGGGQREVLPNEHWVARKLALEPNSEHSWSEFTQMLAIHVVMTNNAFIVMSENKGGQVRELLPVTPGQVKISFHPKTFEKFYPISRSTMFQSAQLRDVADILPERQVIHCRRRVVDGLNGFSTLTAGGPTIALSKAIREYQSRLYDNDGQSRIVFESKDTLTPLSAEAFGRMKRELRAAAKSMFENGEGILLEPGYTANTVAMTAAENELAEIRDAQVNDTARLFRVPPHKLMHFDGTKYENMETLERIYANDTLVPLCIAIEEPIAKGLLTEDERLKYFLQYDRKALQTIDFKVRADVLKVGMDRGAITPDEFREEFGYNPLPNGAGTVRSFQSTMTIVDENNQVLLMAGPSDDGENKDNSNNDDQDKIVQIADRR